jgi:hypothetical protein
MSGKLLALLMQRGVLGWVTLKLYCASWYAARLSCDRLQNSTCVGACDNDLLQRSSSPEV